MDAAGVEAKEASEPSAVSLRAMLAQRDSASVARFCDFLESVCVYIESVRGLHKAVEGLVSECLYAGQTALNI